MKHMHFVSMAPAQTDFGTALGDLAANVRSALTDFKFALYFEVGVGDVPDPNPPLPPPIVFF